MSLERAIRNLPDDGAFFQKDVMERAKLVADILEDFLRSAKRQGRIEDVFGYSDTMEYSMAPTNRSVKFKGLYAGYRGKNYSILRRNAADKRALDRGVICSKAAPFVTMTVGENVVYIPGIGLKGTGETAVTPPGLKMGWEHDEVTRKKLKAPIITPDGIFDLNDNPYEPRNVLLGDQDSLGVRMDARAETDPNYAGHKAAKMATLTDLLTEFDAIVTRSEIEFTDQAKHIERVLKRRSKSHEMVYVHS
jgi:hypothetical protein